MRAVVKKIKKVLGKTRSGKKIYSTPKDKNHSEFTHQDHSDAAKLHLNLADKASNKKKYDHHNLYANRHKFYSSKIKAGIK
jgi:hypothetical protein